jgi:leukotriene-A4 hydrolase
LPEDALLVQSDAFDRVDAQRGRWERGAIGTDQLDTGAWTVQEWLQFLNYVSRPAPIARLQELDGRFKLTGTRNAEIAHAWYRLAIASGMPGLEPALTTYLTGIGRLKLIKPLYADLMKTPANAEFARRLYSQARPGYHAITRRSLDRVVK